MSQNSSHKSCRSYLNKYGKYCAVFTQNTCQNIDESQNKNNSEKYLKIKEKSDQIEQNRLKKLKPISNTSRSFNINTVIDKIVDSVTKMESASSGVVCEKRLSSVKNKEFVSFSQLSNTYENDSKITESIQSIPGCSKPEVDHGSSAGKFDSQWGCDTQLATLADNADAILSLMSSTEMTQTHKMPEHFENPFKQDDSNVSRNSDHIVENIANRGCNVSQPSIKDKQTVSQENKNKISETIESENDPHFLNKEFRNSSPAYDDFNTSLSLDSQTLNLCNDGHLQNFNEAFKKDTSVIEAIKYDTSVFKLPKPVLKSSQFRKNTLNHYSCRIEMVSANFSPKNGQDTDLEAIDFNPDSLKTVDGAFGGFQTAGNKIIRVSEEALKKVRKMFENIDDVPYTENSIQITRNSFNRNQNKDTLVVPRREMVIESQDFDVKDLDMINDEEIKAIGKSHQICQPSASNVGNSSKQFCGFKTASNKPLKISNEALHKANKLFEGIDHQNEDCFFPIIDEFSENKKIGKYSNLDIKDRENVKSNDCEIKFTEKVKTKSVQVEKDIDVNDCTHSEEKIVNSMNETYIIENDKNSAEKISVRPVELQEWEEFFNKSFEILKDSDEMSSKSEAEKGSPDTPIKMNDVTSKDRDNVDDLPLSPIIISQRSRENRPEIVTNSKFITDKKNIRSNIKDVFENTLLFSDEKVGIGTFQNAEGFKTGNNKLIKVSNESLINAKNLFKNIDLEFIDNDFNHGASDLKLSDDSLSVLKPREVFDNQAALKGSSREVNDLSKDDNNDRSLSVNDNISVGAECAREGVSIASCKTISVSDILSPKPTNIFDGAGDEIYDIKTTKNSLKEITNLSCFAEELPVQKDNFNFKFPSFITASNKIIPLSEKAVAKAKTIFKDINQDEQTLMIESREIIELCTWTTSDFENFPSVSENCTDKISKEKFKCTGFMTASNKKVHVSEKAIANAKNVFNSVEEDARRLVDAMRTENIFDESLTKTEKDLNIIEDKLNEIGNIRKTASNRVTRTSEEALAKAKCIFQKIDNSEQELVEEVKTKSNNDVSDNYANLYDKQFLKKDLFDNLETKFVGFSTASNKAIPISKKALNSARNLFKNIDQDARKIVDDFEDEEENYKKSEGFGTSEPVPTFSGFSTANNKIIAVSDSALSKARSLFKDLDEDTVKLPDKFITGGDKIPIGKQKNDERTYQNVDYYNSEPSTSKQKFQGFSTASNKIIHVSKESLSKVKNIFKDLEEETCNLSTEIGEIDKYMASDEFGVLKTTEKVAANLATQQPMFSGFSTASNKVIPVSEHALAKVRDIFKGVDREAEDLMDVKIVDKVKNEKVKESFCGFMTANQNKVKVTDEALSKARAFFEDINENVPAKLPNLVELSSASNKIIDVPNKTARKLTNIDDKISDANVKVISSLGKLAVEMLEEWKNKKEIKQNKSFKRKRSPDTLGEKSKLLLSQEPRFIHENLTQEISESAMALIADENSKANDGRENLLTNIDVDNTPLSPILPSRSKNRAKKVFKVPYKNKTIKEVEDHAGHVLKKLKTCKDVSKNMSLECLNDSVVGHEYNTIDLGNLMNTKLTRREKITLADLRNMDVVASLKGYDVPLSILNLSPENYEQFTFSNERNDIKIDKDSKELTVNQLTQIFVDHANIDTKLIPEGWVLNHTKWIMWKLASYERYFSSVCRNILCASIVLKQLKYRYDKELYNAERPILRKILEMDDAPGRKMVLCVSKIVKLPEENLDSSATKTSSDSAFELELTDGWYSVLTTIDSLLCSAIVREKIQVGTKLIVYGAELLNCGQGISPLEDISLVRLRIHGNSSRRAPFCSRLGACSGRGPLRVSVDSLKVRSGPVPVLRLCPILVYPPLHTEKLPNGDTVTRSDRMETEEASRQQAAMQTKVERLYAQAEEEVYKSRLPVKRNSRRLVDVRSGSDEDLADLMDAAMDPVEFLNNLSESQRRSLESAMSARNEKTRQQIETRVQELMDENGCGSTSRKVVTILKVKALVLEVIRGRPKVSPVMLTLWKPDESTEQMLKMKDVVLEVFKAVPTGVRMGELHLSASKQTVFREVANQNFLQQFKDIEKYKRKCTSIRDVNHPNFSPVFNEVDTVGLVFHIEPPTMKDAQKNILFGTNMQTVYLTDGRMNFLAINFWGGVEKFGFEKLIEIGNVLACCNLQHRPKTSRKRVRNLYATEFTTFTQCPKKKYMETFLKDFQTALKLLNLNEHLEECRSILRDISVTSKLNVSNSFKFDTHNVQNNTSNLMSNSDFDRLFDRSNSNSACKSKNQDRLKENSLSGLDFESTFAEPIRCDLSSTLTSNNVTRSPNDTERRIKRLKMYGEPPPLSPMVINLSRNIKKEFVVPKLDTSCSKNADESVQPRNDVDEVKSKSVDGDESDCKETDDHFREEFEYSPPLSLD